MAKKFLNFTEEDFSWKFDGVEYVFPAGQEMYLEDDRADHFAKHLVDREMNRTNVPTSNMEVRANLTGQCFPPSEVISKLEALQVNEKSKRGRPKKVEPEFEDLDVKPRGKRR